MKKEIRNRYKSSKNYSCSSLTSPVLITSEELKLICHSLVVQVRCSPLFMKKNCIHYVRFTESLRTRSLDDGYFY